MAAWQCTKFYQNVTINNVFELQIEYKRKRCRERGITKKNYSIEFVQQFVTTSSFILTSPLFSYSFFPFHSSSFSRSWCPTANFQCVCVVHGVLWIFLPSRGRWCAFALFKSWIDAIEIVLTALLHIRIARKAQRVAQRAKSIDWM